MVVCLPPGSWSTSSSSMIPTSETESDSTSIVARSIDFTDTSGLVEEVNQLIAEMHLHGINVR